MRFLTYIKLLVLAHIQNSLIFKPHPKGLVEIKAPTDYGFKGVEAATLTTSDNEKIDIWVKAPKENMPYIVFFHGNTGNFTDVGPPATGSKIERDYRLNLLKIFEKYGYGFISVSLRGYGKSTGKPTEAGFEKDIDAIYKFVCERTYKIIIFGESLGAYPALSLMTRFENNQPALLGVAIMAAFSSLEEKIYDMHADFRNMKLLKYLRSRFDNKKILSETSYKGKILLFHPADDKTTAPYHSQLLYEAGKQNNLDIKLIMLQNSEHITWKPDIVVNYIWREISDASSTQH